MNWHWIVFIMYAAVWVLVCLRILFETHSSTKTLAYLLLCTFLPVFGIGFYLAFGINYWKGKMYSDKQDKDQKILQQVVNEINRYNEVKITRNDFPEGDNAELAAMLLKDLRSPLSRKNEVKLLLNGEQKFPELMHALESATHHIHVEYYIFEQDETGTALMELLMKKARAGVEVRVIYDDFGSPSIKKKLEKRLHAAGVLIYPFHKVHFYLLANRINYRNHRKIVVIDGHTGFVGGINVSDKYVNNGKHKLFWRDTHLRIDGPGVYYLQYLFITDWNFCCRDSLQVKNEYFSEKTTANAGKLMQVVASGPDSKEPSVLFSVLEGIYLAKKEILITTPYFIPGDSILDALKIAALSGISVKLLVPGKCDSKLVNNASKANYDGLLQAGVEIYIYKKGFVHSKTLVTDSTLSMVGTANMDHRSFELNFEVNAIIYDVGFAEELRQVFFNDLQDAEKLDPERWKQRSYWEKLPEQVARLMSPSL